MRRAYQVMCVVGMVACMLPVAGYAQEGTVSEPASDAADAPAGVTGEAPVEAPAEDASDVPAVAPTDAPPADVPAAEAPAAPKANSGPVTGPGGRELRTDYPGTEESLRERMETDRIKGVASGEVSTKEVYDLRVKELETRIDDLKDQVFRSKSRIVLLKEKVLGGNIAGSQAVIVHKSELGKSFKLRRMTYILDGNAIRNELDRDGSLSDKESIEILNGPLSPGTHNLSISLEYQGAAAVFGYFDDYTFKLSQSCKFTVEEGNVTVVDAVTYKDGGVTTRADQSAKVRCDASKTKIVKEE